MGLHSAHLHFLLYTKPIGSAMKAVFRSACRKGESFSCVVWGAACGLSLSISACHGFLCGRGGGERERESGVASTCEYIIHWTPPVPCLDRRSIPLSETLGCCACTLFFSPLASAAATSGALSLSLSLEPCDTSTVWLQYLVWVLSHRRLFAVQMHKQEWLVSGAL